MLEYAKYVCRVQPFLRPYVPGGKDRGVFGHVVHLSTHEQCLIPLFVVWGSPERIVLTAALANLAKFRYYH